MNENQIRELIQSLDNDLWEKEIETLMDDIDIDVASISKKAHHKLIKEQKKMKKRRFFPIAAAALLMVIGATTVYATEISDFIKSFLGKTGIYSTVVDGPAYYLESTMELGSDGKLANAMLTNDELMLVLDLPSDKLSDVKIKIGNQEYTPRGYSRGPGGAELYFYDPVPESEFELYVGGKSYHISLTSGSSVVDGGEIIPAEQNAIDWVNIGYKRTERGVQIFTSFADGDLKLKMIGSPVKLEVKDAFNSQTNASNSTLSPMQPIIGYDKAGNAYEYVYEENPVAWPATRFESDAPAGQEISLGIPGIIVGYEKYMAKFNIDIPAVGEKNDSNIEIDLGLQKMVLQSVERTSATTAELKFTLNTGERKEVSIYHADITGAGLLSGELLWQDDTCTMTITFDEGLMQAELMAGWPSFLVSGDWTLMIQ